MKRRLYCVLLLLVVAGCTSQFSSPYFSESSNTGDEFSYIAYFCPQDDCAGVLEQNILASNTSVQCALYDLELKNVIEALGSKSHEIPVKVVLDKRNYEKEIIGPGIKLSDGSYQMHNKFCVIDGETVVTGSFNPTENGAYKNNNNIVLIDSKKIAELYGAEFEELWAGVYGKGEKTRENKLEIDDKKIGVYFCPDDGCDKKVNNALQQANTSIYFMTFSFTYESTADILIMKDIDGVEVKGIFEASQVSKFSQFDRLKDFGITVVKDTNPKAMHHKVFIVDNKTVITGSANPSNNGFYRNDENIVIVKDQELASFFLKEFDRLWNISIKQ